MTELAHAHGSKIVVFHANELFRGGRFAGRSILADEDELQAKIEKQIGELRDAGLAVEPKTVACYATGARS